MSAHRGRLAGTIAVIILVLVGLFGPVDRMGEAQLGEATKRALVAFAAARGLNAAISAVQGTEVALQPAGVGITLTPGELLDPVNDLVERLSWVMLASAVSLGIQQLLLAVSASALMVAALAGAALICLLWLWRPAWRRHWATIILLRLALLTLLLRFAMPGYVLAADAFYQGFLADDYTQATNQIEQTRERIETAEAQAPNGASTGAATFWSRITGSLDNIRDAADLNGRIKRYTAMVGDLADNVIKLAVVFVVQSVLMPLVFLWLLVSVSRTVLRLRLTFDERSHRNADD